MLRLPVEGVGVPQNGVDHNIVSILVSLQQFLELTVVHLSFDLSKQLRFVFVEVTALLDFLEEFRFALGDDTIGPLLHPADSCVEFAHQPVDALVGEVCLEGKALKVGQIFLELVHLPLTEGVVVADGQVQGIDGDALCLANEQRQQPLSVDVVVIGAVFPQQIIQFLFLDLTTQLPPDFLFEVPLAGKSFIAELPVFQQLHNILTVLVHPPEFLLQSHRPPLLPPHPHSGRSVKLCKFSPTVFFAPLLEPRCKRHPRLVSSCHLEAACRFVDR
jgi:hypothetical protein